MTITINSKEYGTQWGIGALEIYCDLLECDLDGLGMISDTSNLIQSQKAILTLIFAGVKNWCEINDVQFDVTIPKLRAAIDEMPQSTMTAIMDEFTTARYAGYTLRGYLYGELDAPVTPATKKKAPRSASAKQ